MTDQTPIKKKLSTTNPGFYDLAEFETGDTIPKENIPPLNKTDVGLDNIDNTADVDKPVSTAQSAAISAAVTAGTTDFETTAELDVRDVANRNRANHTGTQLAATISDFSTAVAALIAGKADTSTTDALQASIDQINALLASNDVSLDELQEIVDYIKENRADIDALGISSIAGLQAALDVKQNLMTQATQVEMESGTETAIRSMSPLNIAQAIAALTATSEINGEPAGGAGYGVASPPIPAGFEAVDPAGYEDKFHAEFGNLRHINSGSIGVVTPAMGFRIEAGNLFSSAYLADYNYDIAAMEADGYFLHHDFYQGGTEQNPGFVKFRLYDKYLCSKVAVGTGFVAASIKNGAPLSTHVDHNPIADITASAGVNAYYAAVRASKGRDSVNGDYDANSIWHCNTRQGQGLFWLMSLCHGQAATSTTYCAWYDATGVSNFPRGNDNSLTSVDDSSLTWASDGYSGTALTGSCSDPAKTSVNGQLCGIIEPGGNMYQVNLGMTRGSDQATGDTNFLILKKHIDPASLDWGSGGPNDAWGTVAELSDRYELHDFPALAHSSAWYRFGNGANQVIPPSDPIAASLGLLIDPAALSTAGSNEFGNDGVYLYHRARLCLLSGLNWGNGSLAGAGALLLSSARTNSNGGVGFRAACALTIS